MAEVLPMNYPIYMQTKNLLDKNPEQWLRDYTD